jgi:hypothetical protein
MVDTQRDAGIAIDGMLGGVLSRERTIAGSQFNRWLVPIAALAIHLCIGMAYVKVDPERSSGSSKANPRPGGSPSSSVAKRRTTDSNQLGQRRPHAKRSRSRCFGRGSTRQSWT